MPFQIVRNDITKVKASVLVNTANPHPEIGGGTDRAIYNAAGKEELLAERKKIGDIAPGQAFATPAFHLQAKHIIHTVGPVWVDGNHGEREILRSCYSNSLNLAAKLRARSIAFPLIATGVYGFPRDEALNIATAEIGKFLLSHEMEVILVVFDKKTVEISGKEFGEIKAYIEENAVLEAREEEYGYGTNDPQRLEMERRCRQRNFPEDEYDAAELTNAGITNKRAKPAGLEPFPSVTAKEYDFDYGIRSVLDKTEERFSPALLRLIDEKGFKKDSECYTKANVDRKLFSKIRSDENYRPKKQTVCAFVLALELNLDEAKELLEKAGYSLSHSWQFDLAIEYCIKNHFYDVHKINEILFTMDLPLLGSGKQD